MYHDVRAIQSAFHAYLMRPQWKWDWFVTQTFDTNKCGYHLKSTSGSGKTRVRLHAEIVNESWDRFMALTGAQALNTWGWMFREAHKDGRPHWHAICHVEEDMYGNPRRKDIWQRMFNEYGRMEIRPFDPAVCTELATYLVKYVAKQTDLGESTFDFDGFLGGRRADTMAIIRAIGMLPLIL